MSVPKTIPPKTLEYISLVTDPYHDRNLHLSGFPDGNVNTSAVKRYYFQTTVSCPFALTAGSTWDFHIFTLPLHHLTNFRSATLVSNVLTIGSMTSQQMNAVNIFYRHYDSTGAILETSFNTLGAPTPSELQQHDPQRTVSLGFELHNTTAALYRSGSLTCYRLNADNSRADVFASDPTAPDFYNNYPTSLTMLTSLPWDLKYASQLPNSRTWEAEKGIYSVSLPAPNNTLSPNYSQNIAIHNGNPTSDKNLLYRQSPQNAFGFSTSWSPIFPTGVMSSRFSDNNQTFTLDMRHVIEVAPIPNSSNLPFASTSPPVDLLFLKLYKRMINTIEPGVPVGFNSAGEWFRRILSIAKDQLPNLIHLLPPQYKPAATLALPLVNNIADKVINKLSKSNTSIPKRTIIKISPKKRPKRNASNSSISRGAKSMRFMPAKKQ